MSRSSLTFTESKTPPGVRTPIQSPPTQSMVRTFSVNGRLSTRLRRFVSTQETRYRTARSNFLLCVSVSADAGVFAGDDGVSLGWI